MLNKLYLTPVCALKREGKEEKERDVKTAKDIVRQRRERDRYI